MTAADPTNIPCRRCGAPMREADDDSHLATTVTMRCSFCGETEPLPRADQPRVLALRAARIERRWAEDAARGPALAYLKITERAGTFVAPYAFAAVIAVASLATGPLTRFALYPVGIIGGAALASYIALRRARTRLRATLGPLIRAFPGAPGRPSRCRRCGGELPAGAASAFATCPYCDAPNLISLASARSHARDLAAVTAGARLYAHDTATEVAAAGRYVARLFTAAFALGAGGGAALAIIAAHLLLAR